MSGEVIEFLPGDTNKMHRIMIVNDNICEIDPDEDFFSSITSAIGFDVMVTEPLARVVINDALEPECGEYDCMGLY